MPVHWRVVTTTLQARSAGSWGSLASMLDAAQHALEANICLALVHEWGGENDQKLINVAVGAELNLRGDPALAAAQAAREAGNAPNSVLAAAASIVGPRRAERVRAAS